MARKKTTKKRQLSPEGRNAISRGGKRRWRGYSKMTLAQKRKALGRGREPRRVAR